MVGAEAMADQSEIELMARARSSDGRAQAELYRCHRRSALRFARRVAPSEDAEDIVAEAFIRVFAALRRGAGPTEDFGAYLRTAVRRTSIDLARGSVRAIPVVDVERDSVKDRVDDDVDSLVERDLVRRAVARLPQRWRSVLWASEVEGRQPRQLAADFGVTPNGAAGSPIERVRDLDVYLVEIVEREGNGCAESALLAGFTRRRLSIRQDAAVRVHLDECGRCTALASAMADANANLRTALSPTLLAVAPLLLARRSWRAGLLATHGALVKGAAAVAFVATAAASTAAVVQLPPRLDCRRATDARPADDADAADDVTGAGGGGDAIDVDHGAIADRGRDDGDDTHEHDHHVADHEHDDATAHRAGDPAGRRRAAGLSGHCGGSAHHRVTDDARPHDPAAGRRDRTHADEPAHQPADDGRLRRHDRSRRRRAVRRAMIGKLSSAHHDHDAWCV